MRDFRGPSRQSRPPGRPDKSPWNRSIPPPGLWATRTSRVAARAHVLAHSLARAPVSAATLATPRSLDGAREPVEDLCDDTDPLQRKPRVELDEVGARLDLGERGRGILDAAAADQRDLAAEREARAGEEPGGRREQGPARQAARLSRDGASAASPAARSSCWR